MCRRNRRKFHASDRNGVYHVFQMSHGAPQGIVMSFQNILGSSQWAQFLVFCIAISADSPDQKIFFCKPQATEALYQAPDVTAVL